MQKNMIPVIVTSLILPCSLLTMDTSSTNNQEPMVIHAVLSPDTSSQNNQQSDSRDSSPSKLHDLSASALVAVIDQLAPEKIERVFDKISQKMSQSDSDSTPNKPSSTASSKEKRKPLPLPEPEKGMPTLVDSFLSKVVSHQTMAMKLLHNGTFNPNNETHLQTLEDALIEAIDQDNEATVASIINLVQADKFKKHHGNLISELRAHDVYTYLEKKHQASIALSNEAIEKSYENNCHQFDQATRSLQANIAAAIALYNQAIDNNCNELDKCVAKHQEALQSQRDKLLLVKALNRSITANIAILCKKDIDKPELNPGLTGFETNKWRLTSIQKNSQIPLIDMPTSNQQPALTDK